MSENKPEKTWKIELDNSALLKSEKEKADLQAELEKKDEKITELSDTLAFVSEKELEAKAKKYNLDPDLPSETLVKKIQRIEFQPPRPPETGTNAPMNDPNEKKLSAEEQAWVRNESNRIMKNVTAPLKERQWETEEDMISDLTKVSREDSLEGQDARKILSELAVKAVRTQHQPLSIDIDPEQLAHERQQAKRENRELMKNKVV